MSVNIVEKRIKEITQNQDRIKSGNSNHIPFFGFSKLQNYVPGIVPGIMYKITSHSGVGKTQLAKYMYVIQPVLYAMKYKKNFKVIYFALEESEAEFVDSLLIHVAKRIEKTLISSFKMKGMSKDALTEAEMKALEDAKLVVKQMMEHIIVVEDIYRPTDIFKICIEYAEKWGHFGKNSKGERDLNRYYPNDKYQIVMVAMDHISLLDKDYDPRTKSYLSGFESIAQWHTRYAKRIITKMWKWAVLNIQQQSLDSETQQFTSRGDSIIAKILPSLDGLANNREVMRDDYVVMGLFAPHRYGIDEYKGYHIDKNSAQSFEDRFRSVHILKNRIGTPNKILPLYFDGRYNYFKELCLPGDPGFIKFMNLLKT